MRLNKRLPARLLLFACLLVFGCNRPGPLKIKKNAKIVGPWCAPNQRVQIGDRVVGHVHDGPKHKDFLVDENGKEYDPERIADQVWSYLERTGDAKRIQDAFSKDAYVALMTVVSIKPVVVILATYQDPSWFKQSREFAYQRWYWRAQASSLGDPVCKGTMQWFSPDLKQKPTPLEFSEAGVAEIPLPKGKLTLTRDKERCKTSRE